MIGNALIAIFCTSLVAIGWYYLSRSQVVASLEAYESPRRNRTRRKVRRMGATSIIVAGLAGFWLALEMKWRVSPFRMALTLLLLSLAVFTMVLSVLVDSYLTHRLRKGGRGPGPPS